MLRLSMQAIIRSLVRFLADRDLRRALWSGSEETGVELLLLPPDPDLGLGTLRLFGLTPLGPATTSSPFIDSALESPAASFDLLRLFSVPPGGSLCVALV